MGYQKRSKSKEAAAAAPAAPMARAKPNGRCKKHPKHKQSPGVCSICLTEKLSQLSTGSSSSRTTSLDSLSSSSSSLSSYSSSSCSSCSSPMHRRNEGKGSLSFLLSGKNVLTKSRSLVFVTRSRGSNNKEKVVDYDNDLKKKKKKNGFWSKLLLRPKDKRIDEENCLMHSRTMRERKTTLSMNTS